MFNAKYVRTKNNTIIVFSPAIQHKEFEEFNILSAGFISFGVDKSGNVSCCCYGKSQSLGVESDPKDTRLAELTILNNLNL